MTGHEPVTRVAWRDLTRDELIRIIELADRYGELRVLKGARALLCDAETDSAANPPTTGVTHPMDPNATWTIVTDDTADDDDRATAAVDLLVWLASGGHAPIPDRPGTIDACEARILAVLDRAA